MKKIISFVLCLSIALTCLAGIAAAESQSFTPSITHTTTSVKTDNYSAKAKAKHYASISITVSGTFIRGSGLSDAGRSYTNTRTSRTSADNPNQATSSINAKVSANNARDYYSRSSGSGKYTWTPVTN
ncbi:MAG: hypothetical protein IKS46_03950 [Clostridia bacterium]|nr:hypothetical protein [Clostridia bacterium]